MTRHIQMMTVTAAALLGLSVNTWAADIPYISGGVGADEREEFAAKEAEYNLKIVVAETSGDYLADVKVVIESASKDRVLETVMEGPILLAKLPPGTYTIRATSGRNRLTQTVSIPAQGPRQVVFRWDSSLKARTSVGSQSTDEHRTGAIGQASPRGDQERDHAVTSR